MYLRIARYAFSILLHYTYLHLNHNCLFLNKSKVVYWNLLRFIIISALISKHVDARILIYLLAHSLIGSNLTPPQSRRVPNFLC